MDHHLVDSVRGSMESDSALAAADEIRSLRSLISSLRGAAISADEIRSLRSLISSLRGAAISADEIRSLRSLISSLRGAASWRPAYRRDETSEASLVRYPFTIFATKNPETPCFVGLN
jgi:hypothetical protein